MNYNIHPEREFEALLEYYRTGAGLEEMPPDMQRLAAYYKFLAPHVERGYLDTSALANLLVGHFGGITKATAMKHARNAMKYYRETNYLETKLLRSILTRKLLKLMDYHYEHLLAEKPAAGQKAIDQVIHRLIELNPDLKLPEAPADDTARDTVFVLSDQASAFPDLHQIGRDRLLELVDSFTKTHELTDEQRRQIIRKDIDGALI